MNVTLRHCALLAAFIIPFAGLALIDSVLLADQPAATEGIMAVDTHTPPNVESACSGTCTTASPTSSDSVSHSGSSALHTATNASTAGEVIYGD